MYYVRHRRFIDGPLEPAFDHWKQIQTVSLAADVLIFKV